MGDDLKPCPFCGVSNTYMANGWLDGRYSEEEWFQVECQECGAVGPSKPFKYQAAEAWDNAGAAVARAEAAEARAAQAEAAGYRRAVDEACAAIVALYADEGASVYKSERAHGRWTGLESAEQAVRALAPVEPVSKADELPGGAA